mgnify:CR=1 FL=1
MADAIDAAELLAVEVQELARSLALVADDRRPRLERAQPAETVAAQHAADRRDRPAEPACDHRGRQPLAATPTISASAAASSRRGLRCGRDERPASPATPSAAKRARHLRTVRGWTPCAAATARTLQPDASLATINLRPCRVVRAFS